MKWVNDQRSVGCLRVSRERTRVKVTNRRCFAFLVASPQEEIRRLPEGGRTQNTVLLPLGHFQSRVLSLSSCWPRQTKIPRTHTCMFFPCRKKLHRRLKGTSKAADTYPAQTPLTVAKPICVTISVRQSRGEVFSRSGFALRQRAGPWTAKTGTAAVRHLSRAYVVCALLFFSKIIGLENSMHRPVRK